MAGSPLAGGLFGVLYVLKGDLDYYMNSLGLRHYNATRLCDHCLATRDPQDRAMLYNNFGHDNRWMKADLDETSWRREYDHEGRTMHPLFSLAGVSNQTVEHDELQVVYLGVAQYLLGSVLQILVFEILPGGEKANMDRVWGKICSHYEQNSTPCQDTNLGLGMFCNVEKYKKEFPRLKGRAAKAKNLVPAIAEIWDEVAPKTCNRNKLVMQELECLTESEIILHDTSDLDCLPLDNVDRYRALVLKFLRVYQQLAYDAERTGCFLWNNPSKFHYFFHLSRNALFVHPRRASTFVDEDCRKAENAWERFASDSHEGCREVSVGNAVLLFGVSAYTPRRARTD